MRLIREHPWYAEANAQPLTTLAIALIAVIAVIDWAVVTNVGLGFLYLFPLVIAAAFLSRLQLLVLTAICTALREAFSNLPAGAQRLPRVALVFLGFTFTALLVREMVVNRRASTRYLRELEHEVSLRSKAEEQLEILINSSPAGIVTVSPDGKIVLSNQAAHQVFGVGPGGLSGQPIALFLPLLEQVHGMQARTAMECRGRRANGEAFLAHLWLSTFTSAAGLCMAAIVLDASEDLRDREESGLRQLLAGSRIMVGAVSHELRNFAGAIAMVHANLGRMPELRDNQDFRALGKLVDGLRSVASSDMFVAADATEGVDLLSVFEDFRIVVGPAAEEAQCEVSYTIPASLPHVRGQKERLLQVFLNLATNSFRAVQHSAKKELAITAVTARDGGVEVRFQDSGLGVPDPNLLFKPFQGGAEASGIGLYVSRAILRSFAGELKYEPQPSGACFVVELIPMRLNTPVAIASGVE
jgi:PAS domain S-box-containing protein